MFTVNFADNIQLLLNTSFQNISCLRLILILYKFSNLSKRFQNISCLRLIDFERVNSKLPEKFQNISCLRLIWRKSQETI